MPLPSIFDGYDTIYWSVYILCVTGAISQTVLLLCLVKDPLKCFRNSATYLVANLAVCDLAVLLGLMFGLFGSSDPRARSLAHTSFFGSVLTVSSIAVDRYMMVAHPFKHRFLMSGKKAARWIAFIWIMSIFSPICHVLTGSLRQIGRFKYGLLVAVIGVTTIAYISTCLALKRQANNFGNGEERRAHRARIASEKRFVTTLVIVAVIAVVSLAPSTIRGYVERLDHRRDRKNDVVYCVLKALLSLNFAVNPFIYFIRLRNYRRTLFIVFCRRK